MRMARLDSLDIIVKGDDIFSLIREGNIIRLVRLKPSLEIADEIARFRGSKAFLLKAGKQFLVAVDDTLILVEGGAHRIVLKANRSENFFWHSTEADEYTFIQEYGQPPTGIYVSEDLESWKRIMTNIELDKRSRHFHSITYDAYRNWLIATLGDGCLTRVVYSKDLGRSWKPLYKGAWQFIPITVCRDRIVFGMDSGIVRGGVGIFQPQDHRWEFKFFKWRDEKVSLAQMCKLKLLSGDIWIAALGTPQAIVVSRDLHVWYPVYVESYDRSFNFHMSIDETDEIVFCSTGNNLIALNKSELYKIASSSKPIALPYKAYREKLIGLGFLFKKNLENKGISYG